jgi:hypothetical protein
VALYREEVMQGELEGANILKELLGCGIWDKSLVGGEGAAEGRGERARRKLEAAPCVSQVIVK